MSRKPASARRYLGVLPILVLWCGCAAPQPDVHELTIAEAHEAFRAGEMTSESLTAAYLERIARLDKSTGLNAIVIVNPQALEDARALDREFAETGALRPLHGIPVIVKDNYDTEGLQTAAGSMAMRGSTPPDDAFQVARLREAGAVILAKSNMAEWAFSPYVTESSLAGVTRNPYDLSRVPAGSSGGTAAAVAANLGLVGLGTDTGNSIRGPSGHNALVGIRSTMGLTSRDGIIPLYLRNDIGGPMARTVEDAVRVLEVIAGPDPADPVTERSRGRVAESYLAALRPDGLAGFRVGVFRRYMQDGQIHSDILARTEEALSELAGLGAQIVDPFDIPDIDSLTSGIWCNTFRHDVNAYLASLGPDAPVKSLQEVYDSGKYAPYIESRIERALAVEEAPEDRGCLDLFSTDQNIRFRAAVLEAMDSARIDAIAYPTWSWPAREVGDMESPAGDNSQILSPQTGFPAITIPTGFTGEGLPAGMTLVGRPYSEPALISAVYAYEQAGPKRRAPEGF